MIEALTPRELDVIRLIARGLPDKEIARALGISSLTVRNHLSVARQKTSQRNRTGLALYAIAHGIVEAPCAR